MQLRAGEQVNHYTLLEPLGKGGQGSVWKVVDPRSGGVVRALKIVFLAETGAAGFDRARREARILASAKHPAIVTCHSMFEEPRDGIVGLVMDLVEGQTLAEAVDAGRLDHRRQVAVLAQVADALAYIHGAGLVHRDLKPENLLLTGGFWDDANRPGTVKLVDFGIAASAKNTTKLTTPGSVIGTLPYLAPELLDPATWGRGEGPVRDVFAFGVLASWLLLNKHPTGLRFDAAAIDFARAYKAADAGLVPWPPAGFEGRWGEVVRECLTLSPSARPLNGAAILEILRTGAPLKRSSWDSVAGPTSPHRPPAPSTEPVAPITAAMTTPVRPSSVPRTITDARPPPPSQTAPPRSRGWLSALLLVLLGALLSAVAFIYFNPPPANPAPPSSSVAMPLPTSPSPSGAQVPLNQAIPACRNPILAFDARSTRFECPMCDGKAPPLPSRDWQMRLFGVSGPPSILDRGKKICAQVPGKTADCAHFTELPDKTGAAGRIPVSTADLNNENIYFTIRDESNTVLAKGYGRRRSDTPRFLSSGLCAGFTLYLFDDDGTNTDVVITVFLDAQ